MKTATFCTAIAFALLATTAFGQSKDSSGWISLFDGKTLDGWEMKGGTADYKVEDGAIVGTTVERSPNTFLCRGPFGDFVLEFDVLCDKPLNSGVQIRSHTYEKDTPLESKKGQDSQGGRCVRLSVRDHRSRAGRRGNFWDEARRTKWLDDFSNKPEAAKAYKDGEWNHYRIVAQGDHIRSWVNGVPCADFHDDLDASGFIGLQVHSVPADRRPVSGPLEEHPTERTQAGRKSGLGE